MNRDKRPSMPLTPTITHATIGTVTFTNPHYRWTA